jgi:hypothetical protein
MPDNKTEKATFVAVAATAAGSIATAVELAKQGKNNEALVEALAALHQDEQAILAAIQGIVFPAPTPGETPVIICDTFLESGTVAAATLTSLDDNSPSWETNIFGGDILVFIGQTGEVCFVTIDSNSQHQLVFAAAGITSQFIPKIGSTYYIKRAGQNNYFSPVDISPTSEIRSAGTFLSQIGDASRFNRVAVKVKSTYDQPVAIKLIGDFFNPMDNPTDVLDTSVTLAAGNITPSTKEYGLTDQDWQPYLALRMTTTVAPTTGSIKVWLAGQG